MGFWRTLSNVIVNGNLTRISGNWTFLLVNVHSVWKSQKKSHSTLRAKRATFTFWVDKSWLKMPKMVNFGEFLKIEACGQIVLPDKEILKDKNWRKMPKYKNSNATFWMIFKHYDVVLCCCVNHLLCRPQALSNSGGYIGTCIGCIPVHLGPSGT